MHSVPGNLDGIGLNSRGATNFANSLWRHFGQT